MRVGSSPVGTVASTSIVAASSIDRVASSRLAAYRMDSSALRQQPSGRPPMRADTGARDGSCGSTRVTVWESRWVT